MNTATLARPYTSEASHYYFPDGTPAYTVPNKSKPGTERPTTVADARKLGLLPSVTTILKTLHKPALESWKIEQAVLACLTTPRIENEPLDAFVARVLPQAEEEARKAREFGTALHSTIEGLFQRGWVDCEYAHWVSPAYESIYCTQCSHICEQVMIGDGYAGKLDLVQSLSCSVVLWDFKTTKTLPDKAWPEHILQLSAYAAALARHIDLPISTANCYISSVDQGKFTICKHGPWQDTYENGFKPMLQYWRWSNKMNKPIVSQSRTV